MQVIAGMYREDLCLDAAQAIEECIGIATPVLGEEDARG